MTYDESVDSLKSAALDLGKKLVMNYLLAQAPFLATGFVGKLTSLFVGKVLEILINKTEFGAFFLFIDVRVNQQGKDFAEAAIKYHQAPDSEKPKYEKDYLEKFYNLVSLKS